MNLDDILNENVEDVLYESHGRTETVRSEGGSKNPAKESVKETVKEQAPKRKPAPVPERAVYADDDDDDDVYKVETLPEEKEPEQSMDSFFSEDAAEEVPEPGDEERPAKAKKKKKGKKQTRGSLLLNDIIFFACAFVIILAIFYIFPPYVVNGTSMNQTLNNKAFGFGARYGSLDHGDIVIVNTGERVPGTANENYIKRLIGLPGDTIKCEGVACTEDTTMPDGTFVPAGGIVYHVYRNGELLEEPYAYYGDGSYRRYEYDEITLGDDEYFVMGDNRFNSHDGRAIGPVSKKDIKCKMLFFLWGKN
ncbi:MAG: signal peptidase I [Lachnospiraceae bacterium]|nr:signal peptidase I [Lachnospiraceae bacterium]